MTTHIDPHSIPQVALNFMNEDHHEAVNLINSLLIHAEAKNAEKVSESLQTFLEHNAEHFAREEEAMRQYNFPPYDCHKGEHERVLAELNQEIQYWNSHNDYDRIHDYITGTLVSWFINHLNTMDTVTAQFIKRFQG